MFTELSPHKFNFIKFVPESLNVLPIPTTVCARVLGRSQGRVVHVQRVRTHMWAVFLL